MHIKTYYFIDEIKREREFYRIRGLPYPKEVPAGTEVDDDKVTQDQAAADSDYHRTDEQVIIIFLHIFCILILHYYIG